MAKKYIQLDLYTGDTTLMDRKQIDQFLEDIESSESYYEEVQGVVTVYKGEEEMVIVMDDPT